MLRVSAISVLLISAAYAGDEEFAKLIVSRGYNCSSVIDKNYEGENQFGKVMKVYCDGGTLTGNILRPVKLNAFKVTMRPGGQDFIVEPY